MKVDIITLPDQSTLPRNNRGDWVCYYKQGASHAADFHKLLKDSGIVTLGASNYKNNKKVYYVTKFGGVFSIDKKEFNAVKARVLTCSRFIAEAITGRSLEDDINNSYEIKF